MLQEQISAFRLDLDGRFRQSEGLVKRLVAKIEALSEALEACEA